MSVLPNNTFANPRTPLYAAVGGGGGDTLQSPVDIIPETDGSTIVNIVASTGSGEANLLVSSTNGNAATVTISNTIGGDAVLSIGQAAAPGGTGAVAIYSPGNLVGGGQINISNASEIGTDADVAIFDTINNNVTLGSGKTAGLTAINNGLLVRDEFVTTPATNGIGITMTSAHVGVIAGSDSTGVTNTLQLGSSAVVPDIITLVDTGATTAQCIIGGNNGTNLSIFGGTLATPNVGVNLRTDAASSGIMTIGSSVNNPTIMFVKDGGTSGSGFVDIAGGVPASIALRLQGSNSQVGSNSAQISTNNAFAANPTLNINNSVDGTPAIVVSSTTVRINKLITGYLNGTTAPQTALADNASVPIPGSDYGSLGAGLFTILVATTNQTATGQSSVQVSSMGYMSSNTQKWVGGNGFGQALVNPTRNFFVQVNSTFTGLIFGNTAGYNMSDTWTVTFIRLTGDLGI